MLTRLSGPIVLAVLLANGQRGVELFARPGSLQRGAMSPTERQTTFGPVVGTDLSAATGTYVWKGVPYAKPPIGTGGDLRPGTPQRLFQLRDDASDYMPQYAPTRDGQRLLTLRPVGPQVPPLRVVSGWQPVGGGEQ